MERMIKAHPKLIAELSILAGDSGVTYIWGDQDTDITLFRDLLKFDVCSTLWIGEDIRVEQGHRFDPYLQEFSSTQRPGKLHHLLERIFRHLASISSTENSYSIENRLLFWFAHTVLLVNQAEKSLYRSLGRAERASRRYISSLCGTKSDRRSGNIFENIREHLEQSEHRVLITGHSQLPSR